MGASGASPERAALTLALLLLVPAYVVAADVASAQPAGSSSGAPVSPDAAAEAGDVTAPDVICAFDRLSVGVFDDPQASKDVVVRPDGYVSLPLVGEVRAAGKTPGDLASEIQRRLATILVDPVVDVAVTSSDASCRSVRIIGAVKRPRAVRYVAGARAIDVLLAAGGLSSTADGNAAVLIRGPADAPRRLPLRLDDVARDKRGAANVAVQPGDVIVVPEGVFAGDWQRDVLVTVQPAFTDNYNLAPAGEEDPAIISAVTPAFRVSGSGARVAGALSAALTGQYVALAESDFQVVPNVLGTGTAELVRDALYLDGATAVEMVALDAATPTSAVATNTRDLTLVQSYRLSPYAVTRLKDFALADLRYILGGTVTDDDDDDDDGGADSTGNGSSRLADSITNGVQARLASPPERQSRFGWQTVASGQQTTRFEDSDVLAGGLTGSPQYALSRSLSVLTVAGYSFLRVGEEELSGPDLGAGFRYEPSPDLSLRALGGWRLENPQAEVLLRYELGARTTLTASYSDSVGVGQTTLLQTLGAITYDPVTRQFIDRQTALRYSSALSGFTLDDALTRTQQANVNLSRRSGNSTYSLGAYLTDQEPVDEKRQGRRDTEEGGATSQFYWGVAAGWEQNLSPSTVLTTSVGFFKYDSDSDADESEDSEATSGSFEDVRLQLGLTRTITDQVSAFVQYYFQRRFADAKDDTFTENAVMAGITRKF